MTSFVRKTPTAKCQTDINPLLATERNNGIQFGRTAGWVQTKEYSYKNGKYKRNYAGIRIYYVCLFLYVLNGQAYKNAQYYAKKSTY